MSGRASLTVAIGLAVASSVVTLEAGARDFRVDDIPNGQVKKCRNCHLADDGKSFTPFGSDARLYLEGNVPTDKMHVNWQKLYARDSDADGWTNGEELGDPTGAWTPGQPNPKGPTSNPGDELSVLPPVCNNGKLDAKEPCEGTMMSKTLCSEANMGDGVLKCTDKCMFDTSGCSNPVGAGGGTGIEDSGGGCNASGVDARKADDDDACGVGWVIALGATLALRSRGNDARRSRG